MLNVIYRGVLMTCLAVMVGFVMLLLLQISDEKTTAAEGIESPGSLVASITWPQGEADVDLWVTGPGEPVPIGYSNKGGVLWNLLRDDLGRVPDFTPLNYENAFTRGLPAGEYRINVQCYRCSAAEELPLDVYLEVAKTPDGGGAVEVIARSTITLRTPREEKTGLAFEVDSDGNVIRDSMTTLFKPLRSVTK